MNENEIMKLKLMELGVDVMELLMNHNNSIDNTIMNGAEAEALAAVQMNMALGAAAAAGASSSSNPTATTATTDGMEPIATTATSNTTTNNNNNSNTTTNTPTTLSSRSDEKWEQHYTRLVEYKQTHGNCLVPTSTELGRWLCRQRHNYKYKGLKEDRKLRLMELDESCLGIVMESHTNTTNDNTTINDNVVNDNNNNNINNNNNNNNDEPPTTLKTKYNMVYESKLHEKWDFFFQQLLVYKSEHGHCNFPTMNGSLGRWISRQRTLYRSNKLKVDRYEKLKSIDFIFEDATALEFKSKLDMQWENMFEMLLEHKERVGHCFDVPEDLPLGKWLYRQRWLYRQGNLREDRAKKLLDVGFEDKKVLKKDSGNGSGGGASRSGGSGRKKKRMKKNPDNDDEVADVNMEEIIKENAASTRAV